MHRARPPHIITDYYFITMTSVMLATHAQVNDNNYSTNSSPPSSRIWNNAVKWIKSNGGYIHPQISYNESERQVYFVMMSHHHSSGSHPSTTSSCSSGGGGDVDAGTILLQIPDACLISLHSVERDEEFGKSLFGVVHSLEASLYHDAQDVVLAVFLAQQQQQQNEESFYKSYLDTLPAQQLLPRQWSSTTLKRRLQGSSLYERIINEQNGIKCEYELIKTTWMQQQQQLSSLLLVFPTFEQYDNMMAQITSRGFDGLGYDGVDVMIPLLDLLNHVRGGQQHGGGGVAHVRYERYHNTKNEDEKNNEGGSDEPTTKRIKMNNSSSGSDGGGVKVTAGQSIVANGTKLQMTYGAKSNATLLGRYGFCIANNVEPDGSCNDVVEIELKKDAAPVKLQRGPKSYTYGIFTKALQLFHDSDAGNDGRRDDDESTSNKHLQHDSVNNEANRKCDDDDREEEEAMNDEDDGGLQAFLDDCEQDDDEDEEDEEGEGDDDLDDMMYHPTSFDDDNEQSLDDSLPSSIEAKGMMNELRALEALYSSLKQARERCEQNSLICSSSDEQRIHTSVEDDYCVILIQSEMQTINFFMKTASILQSKLSKSSPRVAPVKDDKFKITDMDHEHINDLVDAFMTIRYPGVSI